MTGSGLLCLAAVGRLASWTILSPACPGCVSRRFIPVKVKIIRLLPAPHVFEEEYKGEELVSSPLLLGRQTKQIFTCELKAGVHTNLSEI